jgi:hypothetical protein
MTVIVPEHYFCLPANPQWVKFTACTLPHRQSHFTETWRPIAWGPEQAASRRTTAPNSKPAPWGHSWQHLSKVPMRQSHPLGSWLRFACLPGTRLLRGGPQPWDSSGSPSGVSPWVQGCLRLGGQDSVPGARLQPPYRRGRLLCGLGERSPALGRQRASDEHLHESRRFHKTRSSKHVPGWPCRRRRKCGRGRR